MLKEALILPTYLPTIAVAAVMVQAETLSIEVNDNYQKQSYRNRTYINTANGKLPLTIPIKHSSSKGHKKTADAMIENSFLWQRQHWRSIQIAYRSSPFFEFYEDDFKPLYDNNFTKLMDFNIMGMNIILDAIQSPKRFRTTTSYEEQPATPDFRDWASAKMKEQPVFIPEYNQVFNDKQAFNPKVSMIDLLFNKGPEAGAYLQNLKIESDNQ